MPKQNLNAPPQQEKEQDRGMLLKEILADKEKSILFGEMLKSPSHINDMGRTSVADREALAGRLRTREITEDDLEMLTGKMMDEFLENMQRAESLSDMVQSEDLDKLLASKSAKMQSLAKGIGIEGIRTAVLPQLNMLAMRDPQRVQELLRSFELMATREQQHKNADTQLTALLEKYDISKKEHNEILKIRDPAQREEALKNMINDKMGKVRGWTEAKKEKNWLKREVYLHEAAGKLSKRNEINVAKSRYETELLLTGDMLGETVFGDKDMKEAYMSLLYGENPKQKDDMLSFADMNKISLPEQEELSKDFETWFQTELDAGRASDKSSEGQKNHFFDSYVNKKTGNKKGFWSDITKKLIMGLANF